jgi:DNA-directed RNA polymerase subunit omega
MLKPSASELMKSKKIDSKYTLVIATAKRAREIFSKQDNVFVECNSDKPVSIAVNEIAEGSTQQAADTQSVSEGFVEMSNAVDRTTESVSELSKSADVMKQSNETVKVTLKELIEIG